MNVLRVYLWKEWREQRVLLGALGVGLCVATFLIGALLDWKTVDANFTYDWVISMCVGAALLTVGSDLFVRERQGRQLQFLERVPAGLVAAFRAKLSFFLLVLCGAVLYGALLAAVANLLFSGSVAVLGIDSSKGLLAAVAFTVALWVFAVSTWAPTSVMTLPITAVVLALCLLPAWLFLRACDQSLPLDGVFWIVLAGCAFGALFSARICFVHVAARSRPRKLALYCGVASAFVAFLPCTAWAGSIYADWLHWPYRVHDTIVGEGARFAFVNLERFDPESRGRGVRGTALSLDLHTLAWKFEGDRRYSAFGDPDRTSSSSLFAEPRRVALFDHDTGTLGRIYDPLSGLPSETLEASAPRAPHFTPADFGLERFEGKPSFSWAGIGQRLQCFDEKWSPEIQFRTPDGTRHLSVARERARFVRVLADGFLIQEAGRWQRIEPETLKLSLYEHLNAGDELSRSFDDGSCIVLNDEGVSILEPMTGARVPVGLRIPADSSGRVRRLRSGDWSGQSAPLARRKSAVVLLDIESEQGFHRRTLPALLDPVQHTITTPDWDSDSLNMQLCWSEGARAIAVEDNDRIVHYDFETNERRVLLDVADLND